MDVLPLFIYLCELAFVGLVLYHVPPALPMPGWAQTTAQVLLAVIFVVAALNAVVPGDKRRVPLYPMPSIVAPPSIIR